MKKILALLLSMALVTAAVAGCAPSANQQSPSTSATPTPAPSNSSSPTTSATPAPTQSAPAEVPQTLTVALSNGGRTLDPASATDSTSAIFINACYDQLVRFGTIEKDGQTMANPEDIQPSIAKSWTVSDDGLEYVFTLDERAMFANGDPVTADAVIFSLDRMSKSATSSFLFKLTKITDMEKVDDYTVKFTLSTPCAIFFKLLQMHLFSIINPNELDGKTPEEVDAYLKNTTAGSGAFSCEKWDAATEGIFNGRADYWKGAVPLTKVTLKFIPEASSRVLLADKGDVDIAMTIPAKDLTTLLANNKLDVRTYETNRIVYLSLNNTIAPFDNPKVRQAINYAIPYDSLVEDVMYGKAKRLPNYVPSAMPGYIPTTEPMYMQDLEKAKALLAEAGFKDGFEFTLTVSIGNQDWEDSAIVIQSELAKIGVKVNIDKMERSQYLEIVMAKKAQAAVASYSAFVNDPGYFFGNLLYSKGEYNYGAYASARVDAIWDASEVEKDMAKRMEAYKEAQAVVLEDAPWAPLYEYQDIVVLNQNVKDFIYYPDGALRFFTIGKK